MEIKVGDYVRFEGIINKVVNIKKKTIKFKRPFNDHWDDEIWEMNYDKFVNEYKPISSTNIIDLIEVGDYVNGEFVMEIHEKGTTYPYYNHKFKEKTVETENYQYEIIPDEWFYTDEEIQSVVTKEQFEEMEYKVK